MGACYVVVDELGLGVEASGSLLVGELRLGFGGFELGGFEVGRGRCCCCCGRFYGRFDVLGDCLGVGGE